MWLAWTAGFIHIPSRKNTVIFLKVDLLSQATDFPIIRDTLAPGTIREMWSMIFFSQFNEFNLFSLCSLCFLKWENVYGKVPCKYIALFSTHVLIDCVPSSELGFINALERERHDTWYHETCIPGAKPEKNTVQKSSGNNLILKWVLWRK